jgi:uncharacterized membrane protein YczE
MLGTIVGILGLLSETDATRAKYVVLGLLTVITVVQWRSSPVPAKELVRRVPPCIFGLFLFGLGISLFFRGRLGTGPWDVLHGGIATKLGVPVGLVINVVGLLILPIWIPLKVRVGLGTVLNALLIGMFVDLIKPQLDDANVLWLRILCTLSGVVIIGAGSAFYIGAGLGSGPRDGLMIGLKRLGFSVRAGRTLIEAVTLLLGWLLGGKVGVGTIMFLIGIGPIVQFLLPKLSLPPLEPLAKADPTARTTTGVNSRHL